MKILKNFFDENEIFASVILNLKEELKDQIDNIKQKYDEERKNGVRKIKMSFLKKI